MTDTTNTGATITVNKESLLQHIENFFYPAVTTVEDDLVALETKFDADVWPEVKTFILTLSSQVGQAALKSAIAAAPLLLSGGFGAAAETVGAAVVATATVDAPIDATTALQATQAALQVVKVANSTVTAGDAPTVAAIAAATPAA
jgi:hypothetical protein